jgi:hypothetical protein
MKNHVFLPTVLSECLSAPPLNYLVLACPIGFSPLNFYSHSWYPNFIILSIIFTGPKQYHHFSYNAVNRSWISTSSLKLSFLILFVLFSTPSVPQKNFVSIAWTLLLFLCLCFGIICWYKFKIYFIPIDCCLFHNGPYYIP